jgi:hypothetical protein
MPWAWMSDWVSSSAVARRCRLIVSGMPSANRRTSRTYAKARRSLVRTFVAVSYSSSGARNRNPTPLIVVM